MVSPILNPIRSRAGVATVTVMTKPYPCPGRCVFCPTEPKAPKSYLLPEPPVMRAIDNDYDPYRQVISRLTALHNTGHATDKIELIVKGGTWSSYPWVYQQEFIRRCFEAANGMVSGQFGPSLEEAHRVNETAQHRIVGLTIETRPDHVTQEEILRLRKLGVTRVELGVQSLEDRVLKLVDRGHGVKEIAQATGSLREAGFKVAYHMMPGLPGATLEDDRATFRRLFDDPAFRPDNLKIYPCVVLETAALASWWRQGRYQPEDEETLTELLIELKSLVPPYVRIERIVRDIPSDQVLAGCRRNNLRQEIHKRMRARGLFCQCIRCRQVTDRPEGTFIVVRRDYEASGGREIFLSFESSDGRRLASLLRLRIQGQGAMVRELHTYGWHLPIPEHRRGSRCRAHRTSFAHPPAGGDPGAVGTSTQHQGFGKRLMEKAEAIAKEEFWISRIKVIAGIGVRGYYRKLGYQEEETYMVKDL